MNRLDKEMLERGMTETRSQAENWIRLGKVFVDGKQAKKTGQAVGENSVIELKVSQKYVSRAGLKLASVADALGVNFGKKIILDVGSSTGGFTDFSLQKGASKVFAVDVGTDQLHPSLRSDERVILHEKTDIRDFYLPDGIRPDIVVMDVSFISSRELLPHIFKNLSSLKTEFIIMVKPQFEAGKFQTNKGVIKNDTVRRKILKDFEAWVRQYATVVNKQDSAVAGAKGNRERFYLLKKRK